MKKLLIVLGVVLLSILSYADTTTVFEEYTFPIIPDTLIESDSLFFIDTNLVIEDSITIGIWYVNDSIDSALVVKYGVYQATELVYLTIVKYRPHVDSGFTIVPYVWIKPQPEPGDINKDGVVDWVDLWMLFMGVIR